MSDLQIAQVILTGGIQDSKAQPEPTDLTTAHNVLSYRGRLSLRAPCRAVTTFIGEIPSATDTYEEGTVAIVDHTADTGLGQWEEVVTGIGTNPGIQEAAVSHSGMTSRWLKTANINTKVYRSGLDLTYPNEFDIVFTLGRSDEHFANHAHDWIIHMADGAGDKQGYYLRVMSFNPGGGPGTIDIRVAEMDSSRTVVTPGWQVIEDNIPMPVSTRLQCKWSVRKVGSTWTIRFYYRSTIGSGTWIQAVGDGIGDIGGDGTYTIPTDISGVGNKRFGFSGEGNSLASWFEVDDLQILTSGEASRILAGAEHEGQMYVVAYLDAFTQSRLFRMDADGTFNGSNIPEDLGVIWTGATAPRPVLASFQGGSATAGVSRLYIADYDGVYDTRYWDSTAESILSLVEDLNDDGTKEGLRFHYVFPYQFHLWGAGFLEGTIGRPELLRFTRPGSIPEDEPAVLNNKTREWWNVDFRPIGRRGDKIRCISTAGASMIVFKRTETYALFGYDAGSWASRQVSRTVGAVGPYAAASGDRGLCYFWSDSGPFVTDGQELVFLGNPIRKRIQSVTLNNDRAIVVYSPDEELVRFMVAVDGKSDPGHTLVFDIPGQRWFEEDYQFVVFDTGGETAIGHAFPMIQTKLEGAQAPPSALSVCQSACTTELAYDEMRLEWSNGDTAVETVTEIYRDTSSPAVTKIAEVGFGVNVYTATGLSSITTYYWRVRHRRNALFSAYSNEVSLKSRLREPTGLTVVRIVNGLQLTFTNHEASADISIERKPLATGSFSEVTLLTNQAATSIQYDDTTTSCGTEYEYRLRTKKAGETDSIYTDSVSNRACSNSTFISCRHVNPFFKSGCGGGNAQTDTIWSTIIGDTGDLVRVSRSINGAPYLTRATVPIAVGEYIDTIPYAAGGGTSITLQYKFEILDGATVVDTCTSTLSNHSGLQICGAQ